MVKLILLFIEYVIVLFVKQISPLTLMKPMKVNTRIDRKPQNIPNMNIWIKPPHIANFLYQNFKT